MTTTEQLIANYGYVVLFIGTFLEGETILIIAGIAAAQGLLDLPLTIVSAFLGTLSGDQLYFLVGRHRGGWLLEKMPRWRTRVEGVLAMLERHSSWLLLTFRFMYGVRNVTSFAVGMSGLPTWRFSLLNGVGALLWALSFGWGGYLFGGALLVLMKDIRGHQITFLLVLSILALVAWVIRLTTRRRRTAYAEPAPGHTSAAIPASPALPGPKGPAPSTGSGPRGDGAVDRHPTP